MLYLYRCRISACRATLKLHDPVSKNQGNAKCLIQGLNIGFGALAPTPRALLASKDIVFSALPCSQ